MTDTWTHESIELKDSLETPIQLTHKKEFVGKFNLTKKQIINSLEFSVIKSYGERTQHKNIRAGGTNSRKNFEVFINTIQGKLAEYYVYNYLKNKGLIVHDVDINIYEDTNCDLEDLIIEVNKKKIRTTIKSTKNFGNLLLLETENWNKEGYSIIGDKSEKYDIFILVRVKLDLSVTYEELKQCKTNADEISLIQKKYKSIVNSHNLSFDIPGYLEYHDIKSVIATNQIIKQNSWISKKKRMDADNYYVQSGNLKDINNLIHSLKKEK